TKVTQLIVNQSNNSVLGVKCRSKLNSNSQIEVFADFIVDCTGRYSSSTKWLKQYFNLIIPNEQLHVGTGYVSFVRLHSIIMSTFFFLFKQTRKKLYL
ncbi:unnamed protein product, partial [Rotaria sp. Silwood1]